METEVLPLVEPAKELIDLVSEIAKKQLKELTAFIMRFPMV